MPRLDACCSSPIRSLRSLVLLALLVFAACFAGAAQAQSVESVLSPGKVIEGHAKVEGDCKRCHVRFDRAAQDGLCMDCHKEVGQDMRQKTGFHGRQKPQACRECHTDHRGRDARVIEFDPKTFDHNQSDFTLRGKHGKTECAKCHVAGKKYRAAASDCLSCHRKDDVHKGSLGAKCQDCHTESNWKEAKFDHSTTRFKLTGKHADAKCNTCHKNNAYKDTPMACIACHRKEDKHKGRYGEKCETCHGTRDWKTIDFDHDTQTKYALRGKHRTTKCESCHVGNPYKEKTPTACNDCHKKDDKHKGSLGTSCESCHNERTWKETGKFDHDRTHFPLLGKHAKVECKDCHKSTMFKEAPSACIECHRKDDKHEGTLGDKCKDCHIEQNWKKTSFDHDRTRFALRGAHMEPKTKCADCHRDLRSYRNTARDCLSCHKKDDKHEGQQGKECDQCHNDRDWKTTRFDHGRTRFPLLGKHVKVECKACHESRRFKDAKRECLACHKKDDKHKGKLGARCESCHNARDWKIWDFDHSKRTDYKLDGAHVRVACESCHTREAPAGKDAASVPSTCVGCHRSDDVHDGGFGGRCEQCHVTESWKSLRAGIRMSSETAPTIGTQRQHVQIASAPPRASSTTTGDRFR